MTTMALAESEVGSALMVSTTRSGLEVDFDKNPTKLYDAICDCNWEAAHHAVKDHPEQALTWVVRHGEGDDGKQQVMWRFLPLHSACARQPPSSLISALLKAYPGGASCVDDQGMYALHYACGNQASREVIRLLLDHNPEATKKADPRGMLPIHYLACWGPSSVSVIDMLLVANRDVGSIEDEDGNTPLDLALEGEYPERDVVVSALRKWFKSEPTNKVGAKGLTIEIKDKSNDENQQLNSPRAVNNEAPALPVDTPRTVNKLRNYLSELKEKQEESDATWEQKVREKELTMQARHEELRENFDKLVTELQSVKADRDRTAAQLQESKKELAAKDEEVEKLLSEKLAEQEAEFKTKLDEKEAEWESKNAELLDQNEKLKAEITEKEQTLSAQLEEAKEQLEKQLADQEEHFKSTLAEKEEQMAAQLASSEKEKETELGSTKTELESVEAKLSEVTEKLKACEEDRDMLRLSLADTTTERDVCKKMADGVNNRLGSLAASLASMWEEQEKVVAHIKGRSESLKTNTELRRAKLRQFLELEDDLASGLVVECQEDAEAFEKQMKEMKAISAVIDVMRL